MLALDRATGKLQRESPVVPFPESVGANGIFNASARLDSNGDLLVRWTATEFYDGGIPKSIVFEMGVLRMNPATGETAPGEPAAFPTETPANSQSRLGGVNFSLSQLTSMKGNLTVITRTLVAKAAAGETLWQRPLRTETLFLQMP